MSELIKQCSECDHMKGLEDSDGNTIYFCMNKQSGEYLEETGISMNCILQIMSEPLPCPFCGGKADWWDTDDKEYPYQIGCNKCLCRTAAMGDKQDCLDDWNRRVSE